MFDKKRVISPTKKLQCTIWFKIHSYLKIVVFIIFYSINCSNAAEHDKYGNFKDAVFQLQGLSQSKQ